ncbi:type II toxin-antitoxin system HicB family antitoxin [Cyanobacterium aponinum]|uniref:Uncharacterized protein family UPF0150 n=1 Tax=Cyanobacterium aponinum (strain PCC 10605) TaxID=755178 RepID=K9Z9M8_CYAAP|nr:DUF1902 domain-containing protein [Cyanobacterium aponinum]AFZ55285.1 Uncharacterized protein family UPF0150 [Cyanobacterium aponinum PCC 10605]
MKTLIRLKIEMFKEDNITYFVATSDDLEGLVAEGETIEQVLEIAQDVAKILLEFEQNNNNKNIIKDIPNEFEYPLFMEV